jgi:hypothetical protein
MAIKPISTLKTEVATAINDNTTGDVTPADVRTSIIDTIDSIQAFNTIAVSGQSSIVADATLDTLNIAGGNNIVITTDASTDTLVFETTAEVNQNAFSTIAVAGQSDVVADLKTDTLNLVAGSNVTITTNASTDTITISSTGGGGGGGSNTFSTISVSGQPDIIADSTSDTLTFVAGANVTLTTNATTDAITIASTTTPQNTFSTVAVSGQSDIVADSASDTLNIVAGSNISITTNASTDTITISATGGGGGGGGDLLASNNLSELTNFATARSNLGVAIGTNVQAFSSVLQATTASFTTADETKLDGIATGAEVNQNTFSTISVSGQSDIVAEAKTDTLTIVAGSNIALTTNATTDTLTIATTGLVQSNITGITGADAITNIVSLTQAEYDALTPKNASTFYVIVG